MELINFPIFGNTIAQWFGTGLIFVLSLVASRVTIGRLSKSIRYFTRNRESKLDELLIGALDQPLFFLLVLCGIWFGFGILTVSMELADLFQRIWQFLFTLACTWMISRLYGVFHTIYLVDYFQKRTAQLDDQLLKTFSSGMRTIIWALGGLLALNNVGYDITAVIVGLAIAGLAIALAAQDLVANLFGGVTIFTQQPFKVEEHIEVGEINGHVKTIGLRTTTIQDSRGHEILVPNRYFAQNPVKNISTRENYVIETIIPLSVHTAPEQVDTFLGFLRGLPTRMPDLAASPLVGIQNIDRLAINIEFRFAIKKFDPETERYSDAHAKLVAIRSDVYMRILNELKAQGLSLASQSKSTGLDVAD